MFIKNQELIVRSATKTDIDQLLTWWNDGSVMAHAGFPLGLKITYEAVEKRINLNHQMTSQLMILEVNEIAIGEMSYRMIDHKAEIGIKLCESNYQNQGLGPRFLKMLMTYLFTDESFNQAIKIHSVILDTNLKNLRAQKTYERLGFQKLRINYDSWKDQLGDFQSSVDYEMTKDMFLKQQLIWNQSYIKSNQKAWESAFDHKDGDYAKDMIDLLKKDQDIYLNPVLQAYFDSIDLENQTIYHVCCNNGRELLTLSKRKIQHAYGFDIAQNMVDYANHVAAILQLPATFIQSDILKLSDHYDKKADIVLITIGALCWFDRLDLFFEVIKRLLKPDGKVVIHEIHPVVNMLATKDENLYQEKYPSLLIHDYFKNTAWETGSMGYMTDSKAQEETYMSFSHGFDKIINAAIKNGLFVLSLEEYDVDYGNLVPDLDHKGVPLSYLLILKGDH